MTAVEASPGKSVMICQKDEQKGIVFDSSLSSLDGRVDQVPQGVVDHKGSGVTDIHGQAKIAYQYAGVNQINICGIASGSTLESQLTSPGTVATYIRRIKHSLMILAAFPSYSGSQPLIVLLDS